jgi:hypothetical protein
MCEFLGGGRFRSRVADTQYEVACSKVVDSTYMNVMVPSIRPPAYEVAPEAHCAPLNALPRTAHQFEHYVIVGAGKTGMDACLFLLKSGVDPNALTWIMPRDSWILDRAQIQPRTGPSDTPGGIFAQQLAVISQAESLDDLFARLNAAGLLLRLDDRVKPTMFRCATVTQLELEQLRRIRDVVRLGRVKRIEEQRIVLEQGDVATSLETLHVDCTADGLANRPVAKVFDGDAITLQSVRTCQQVFSAAFIAHVECSYPDEATKNELCSPVPHPNTDLDFLRTTLRNGMNQARWSQDPALTAWLQSSRLDGFSSPGDKAPEGEEAAWLATAALTAAGKLQSYLAEAEAMGAS